MLFSLPIDFYNVSFSNAFNPASTSLQSSSTTVNNVNLITLVHTITVNTFSIHFRTFPYKNLRKLSPHQTHFSKNNLKQASHPSLRYRGSNERETYTNNVTQQQTKNLQCPKKIWGESRERNTRCWTQEQRLTPSLTTSPETPKKSQALPQEQAIFKLKNVN